MSKLDNDIILSVESAISGGSISLFAGGIEIGQYVGTSGVSRSEDLLPNVEQLLERCEVETVSVDQLVVSAGPGSFTGIRIGIATALGLSTALGISFRQLSLLEAIANTTRQTCEVVVGLPVGRETVCWQRFRPIDIGIEVLNGPSTLTVTEFAALVNHDPIRTFMTTNYLFEGNWVDKPANLHDLGDCLATYLGRAAIETSIVDAPQPLFISKHATG